MRTIDADALIKAFNEAQVEFDEYYKGLGRAKVITDNAPTVQPEYFPPCEDCNKKMEEIRQAYDKMKAMERPKGEWIIVRDKKWGDNVKCPFCGKELAGTDLNFCCKCGAKLIGSEKMNGGEEE